MQFAEKHQPATVHDLVFQDPRLAQIIQDYAAGIRQEHLLLEGPTSSGKSIAARMVIQERLSHHFEGDYNSTYHGQGFDHHTIEEVAGDWNFQSMSGWAYSVIDEVDFASANGRREIRKFIDSKSVGTLICTTNFVNKLEHAFVSRFRVEHVAVPAPTDWHNRAQQILHAEGHAVTSAQVQRLMANFSGNARDFLRELQDVHISLLRAKNSVQKASAGGTNGQSTSATALSAFAKNSLQVASAPKAQSK